MQLSTAARDVRGLLERARQSPALAWLSPPASVRLLEASGGQSVWAASGRSIVPAGPGTAPGDLVAVELPQRMVLERFLTLPKLSDSEVSQAVALDVAAASPFPQDDVVWGHRTRPFRTGALQIAIALASRAQVQRFAGESPARLPPEISPEMWFVPEEFGPIVLAGFGEARRLEQAQARRRVALLLLALAAVLVALVALTPVVQARMRALEAVAAFDSLTKKVEPTLRDRAALLKSSEAGAVLKTMLVERSDPLYAVDLLTRVLPDDTSLLGVQLQGSKVSINGLTANAASLMQSLSSRPELREVRAPTAATRPPGATRDIFSVEMTLASPAAQEAAAAKPQSPASASGSGSGSGSSGGASFGGASFGGAPSAVAPASSPQMPQR